MAENTKIEWCDHTVNLWWGCSKVHTGCKHCYAEHFSDVRYKNDLWGENSKRKQIASAFDNLLKYEIFAKKTGVKLKIFVGSMMDIFENRKPLIDQNGNDVIGRKINNIKFIKHTDSLRESLFWAIDINKFPNLIFLFLTKRPENIPNMLPTNWIQHGTPVNVWIGVSVSDQKTADELIPKLLEINTNRFLSLEPQIGPVDLTHIQDLRPESKLCTVNSLTGEHRDMGRPCPLAPILHWVIQGGESGHKKRPFDINWATMVREQCQKFKTPYFFKQIDKKQVPSTEMLIREFPKSML